jgi:hypothetical protein
MEIKRDRYWELVALPDSKRNYAFFAALSGVRGRYEDDACVFKRPDDNLRDVDAWPSDMSYEMQALVRDQRHYADHSFGWATLFDMDVFDPQWDDNDNAFKADKQWHRWVGLGKAVAKVYGVGYTDVRFLWGFDN